MFLPLEVYSVYIYLIFLLQLAGEKVQEFWDKYDFFAMKREVMVRLYNLKYLHTQERAMNFLQANENTRDGIKVRRKSWPEGHRMWWDKKEKCLVAGNPYGKQDKHLETGGYTYVCEGDDVEALDWEKC